MIMRLVCPDVTAAQLLFDQLGLRTAAVGGIHPATMALVWAEAELDSGSAWCCLETRNATKCLNTVGYSSDANATAFASPRRLLSHFTCSADSHFLSHRMWPSF